MSASILQRIVGVGLLALFALLQTSPASAGAPQRFVVFGDSLSDPGNAFLLLRDVEIPPFDDLIPDAPYARGALHFSNGATWVEQLSVIDHALPSAGPALLHPVLFSNYAVGGARARREGPFNLSTQVGLFVHDFGGQGPADALYVVFVGGNDLRDALSALAVDSSGATSAAIVQAALFAIRDNLLTLYAAGGRSFLVANAPDISLTPAVRLLDPAAQGAARFLAVQFNGGLEAILEGLELGLGGTHIARLDVFRILNEIVAAPGTFGLAEVIRPCIAVNTKAQPFCANPGTFLFWDGIHPTKAGHRILAERARAVLSPAP
jgi:phospholipase/lecithinase/hemolysin